MNGRIYDGQLGRFLSADTVVQFPGNLQSFNRYSYVMNNPLSFTDLSGFAVDINLIDPNEGFVFMGPPNLYKMLQAYPHQAGRTSVAVHGQASGGFSADQAGTKGVTESTIDKRLTSSGHTHGDEIVLLVCGAGRGANLRAARRIAASQGSPVAVATNNVKVTTGQGDTVTNTVVGSARIEITNGGHWLIVEPSGNVRERGTAANVPIQQAIADAAQATASAATSAANVARDGATAAAGAAAQAAAGLAQARLDANAAKGTSEEKAAKAAVRTAQSEEKDAQKAAKQAAEKAAEAQKAADEAAKRAAEEAARAAQMAREAANPI